MKYEAYEYPDNVEVDKETTFMRVDKESDFEVGGLPWFEASNIL